MKGKTIILGVTSSISCYKVIGLARELRSSGAKVFVIMTRNALNLVPEKEFESASGNKVAVELFKKGLRYADYIKKNSEIKHISLADKADILVIVPATANIIGKIANGIANDLLTTSVMATKAPVLICPAMNMNMWQNPIVQENVSKLKKNGYEFIGPDKGMLACGYEGVGRLADLGNIIEGINKILSAKDDFKGKKVLVTAGATMEDIDPVRVITNKSSGKMGVMIAEEAAKRGAEVTLIRGINSVEPYFKGKEMKVKSSIDMLNAIKNNMDKDIIIHTAAVSDFTTAKAKSKIKSGKELNLELTPTTKILERIKKLDKNAFLVGFKAECNISEKELVERAYNLLKKSNADLIIANDVGKPKRGFDVDTNEVYLVDRQKKIVRIELDFKRVISNKILDEITKRI